MPYKLKPDSVESIAAIIAERKLEKTFENTHKVDGEKLISLTNSRQINSFLIRSLFHEWRKEIEQLESPYFDFKHEKVKDALKAFMNVLSNHISIDRVHLQPLLKLAIADTFRISFAPQLYLEEVLDRVDRPQDLKKEFKYIKTHRDLFKSLIEQIDEFSTKASILTAYEEIGEDGKESIDAELIMDKLDEKGQLNSLFDYEEPEIPAKEKAVEEVAKKEIAKSEEEVEGTLNEQFKGNAQPMTLAEKLQQKMNKGIESSLTLNEKFMFQNALFGGNAAIMKEALKVLDSASDLNDALTKANQFNQGWDMESEEIEAFMGVLERRFA